MTMLGKWRATTPCASRVGFEEAQAILPLAGPIEATDPKRDVALSGHRNSDARVGILPRQSASAQLPLAKTELPVLCPAGGPALPAGAPVRVLDL